MKTYMAEQVIIARNGERGIDVTICLNEGNQYMFFLYETETERDDAYNKFGQRESNMLLDAYMNIEKVKQIMQ